MTNEKTTSPPRMRFKMRDTVIRRLAFRTKNQVRILSFLALNVWASTLHAQSSASFSQTPQTSQGQQAPLPQAPQSSVAGMNESPQQPIPSIQTPQSSPDSSPSSKSSSEMSVQGRPGGQVQEGSLQPSATEAVSGDYILRGGDVVDMMIYREPDLAIKSKIGKDGMVELPFLGGVKIGGLSVRSASSLIRDKYNADYIVNPQVYLTVVSFNQSKFTVIGQVSRPGTYQNTGGETMGLLDAIGMAGGFTKIADRGHVIIKRHEGNSIRTIKVNAKKLTDSGTDIIEIQPGDVINVGESWF